MGHAARIVALVTAVAVAGLSSALAVCVAGCMEPAPQSATHACHEDATPATSLQADIGGCGHAAPSIDRIALARDSNPLVVVASTDSTIVPVAHVRATRRGARAAASPPTRPPASPPILRI